MNADTWINLAGVLIVVALAAGAGIWQIGSLKSDLLKALADHRQEIDAEIAEFREKLTVELASARAKLADDLALDRRVTGDAFTALRERVNDVEKSGLDKFVRRESFYEVTRALREALEQRIGRMEEKIDRLIDRLSKPTT